MLSFKKYVNIKVIKQLPKPINSNNFMVLRPPLWPPILPPLYTGSRLSILKR